MIADIWGLRKMKCFRTGLTGGCPYLSYSKNHYRKCNLTFRDRLLFCPMRNKDKEVKI